MNALTYRRLLCILVVSLLLSAARVATAEQPYDPLAVSDQSRFQTLDFTVKDHGRQRDIPIRVYLPSGKSPVPVVLFSHGLGGSREGSAYLGNHWAGRGYVAVFIQHPGSDTSVWQDKPLAERMDAMKRAANLENFLLRVKDIHVVLDQFERWNQTRLRH